MNIGYKTHHMKRVVKTIVNMHSNTDGPNPLLEPGGFILGEIGMGIGKGTPKPLPMWVFGLSP